MSLVHATTTAVQAFLNLIPRRELVGVVVFILTGVALIALAGAALIALAPVKQTMERVSAVV
jgi:hypothetical protein